MSDQIRKRLTRIIDGKEHVVTLSFPRDIDKETLDQDIEKAFAISVKYGYHKRPK